MRGPLLAGTASVAALALVGCSSPDLSPVAAVAAGPFACDGVPLRGAELMSGRDDLEVTVSNGGWQRPTDNLDCELSTSDGEVVVHVSHRQVSTSGFRTTADFLAYLGEGDRHPIDADASGGGFVDPATENSAGGVWTCDDVVLQVIMLGRPRDRDPVADVSAFITSMLPWACGDEDAPPADVEPSS